MTHSCRYPPTNSSDVIWSPVVTFELARSFCVSRPWFVAHPKSLHPSALDAFRASTKSCSSSANVAAGQYVHNLVRMLRLTNWNANWLWPEEVRCRCSTTSHRTRPINVWPPCDACCSRKTIRKNGRNSSNWNRIAKNDADRFSGVTIGRELRSLFRDSLSVIDGRRRRSWRWLV